MTGRRHGRRLKPAPSHGWRRVAATAPPGFSTAGTPTDLRARWGGCGHNVGAGADLARRRRWLRAVLSPQPVNSGVGSWRRVSAANSLPGWGIHRGVGYGLASHPGCAALAEPERSAGLHADARADARSQLVLGTRMRAVSANGVMISASRPGLAKFPPAVRDRASR